MLDIKYFFSGEYRTSSVSRRRLKKNRWYDTDSDTDDYIPKGRLKLRRSIALSDPTVFITEKLSLPQNGCSIQLPPITIPTPPITIPTPPITIPTPPIIIPNNETHISGYVYCISNESFLPNTYKIGFTLKTPSQRMKGLQSSGVPQPFKLEFAKRVFDSRNKEQLIHKILDKYRVNSKREFFCIPIETIRVLFDCLDGDWVY